MAAIPGSLPIIGQSFALRLTNLPITGFFVVAVPFLGFDTISTGGVPLPRDLGPIGMAGCTQYVDPFQSSFLFTPTGTVDWPLAIPNVPAFAGIQVHFQAAIVDLPINQLGLTATNAATVTLGW